jgi:hypothetical protein
VAEAQIWVCAAGMPPHTPQKNIFFPAEFEAYFQFELLGI